jgi:hypothetical protein
MAANLNGGKARSGSAGEAETAARKSMRCAVAAQFPVWPIQFPVRRNQFPIMAAKIPVSDHHGNSPATL